MNVRELRINRLARRAILEFCLEASVLLIGSSLYFVGDRGWLESAVAFALPLSVIALTSRRRKHYVTQFKELEEQKKAFASYVRLNFKVGRVVLKKRPAEHVRERAHAVDRSDAEVVNALRSDWATNYLQCLAFFVPRDDRNVLEVISSDLRRDAREMRSLGLSERTIFWAKLTHILRITAAFAADWVKQSIGKKNLTGR